MANCCSHPSSSLFQFPAAALVLVVFLLLTPAAAAASTSPTTTAAIQELESMMEALRNHGFTLFSNAIATSDVQYQLLADASRSRSLFTIFAPKDSLLYALDMISDSATYVRTLRYHVVPNQRHSFLDLRNVSSPFLDTLLPQHSVLIARTLDDAQMLLEYNTTVLVDGVRVSAPDLFLSSSVAVHGIDGLLVTGMNVYQDLDNNPRIASPPAESPAAQSPHVSDWNNNNGPVSPEGTAGILPGRPHKTNNILRKRMKRGQRKGHLSVQRRRLRGHLLDDL